MKRLDKKEENIITKTLDEYPGLIPITTALLIILLYLTILGYFKTHWG